jgi:hypothetical protein
MNTNDDSFLTSLLQYHTRLIDQKFVDNIINKIQQRNQFRMRAMILAIIIASVIAIPLLISIIERFNFVGELSSISPYLVTLILLSVLGFGAWLANEDF